MNEDVQQVFEQCKWLIERGRSKEQAKLLLPRIASKRRAENKEKKTRVVFECTPEQFAAFHGHLKRIREHIGNVTVAQDILNDWLSHLNEDTMDLMSGEREDE